MKNPDSQFDIVIREDKMAASIGAITPPAGNAKPVTVESVEQALADSNIVFGIDKNAIESLVSEVAATGTLRKNITVAVGEPAKAGESAQIEMKIGQDAANKDPQAAGIVKPGQIVAVKVPATKGKPGRNVLGGEVPGADGADIKLSSGENVTIAADGSALVAAVYGAARATGHTVSVTSLIQVSPDDMWAEMPLFPTLADNSKLTLEDVTAALKQAGVVYGVQEAVIKEALETDEPTNNIRVAEATPATDGVDALIELKFRLNGEDPETVDTARRSGEIDATHIVKELVTARDILATKTPLRKSADGSTVKGGVLKGVKPIDKKLTAGMNVTILDDQLTFVVAEDVVGYADYVDGRLCVEDPLRISQDKSRAYLSVHRSLESGRTFTTDIVEELLTQHEIVHGIDRNAIEEALAGAVSKDVPIREVVVAEGRALERGQDARIEFKVSTHKSVGTLVEGTDRIDYKEREAVRNVKEGDILAVKVPLTPGEDGVDVFGHNIPAESGSDEVLTPTSNVAVSEDGLTFTSEIDGMVILTQDSKIGVFKQYQVSGDVDFSIGNLTLDGSVDIKGWIRSGFSVNASGDIRVGGGVEDAILEAGANIYVNGGIIGSGEGKIHAGGDLQARFFDNARVHADGNIMLRDDAIRSVVSANGSIVVTEGKGRIIGSLVKAQKGIEVNEIGSEVSVNTRVIVGTDPELLERMADVKKKLADLKLSKAKIDRALAPYARQGKSNALPKDTIRKLDKIVKLRRQVVDEERSLGEHREKIAQKISQTQGKHITVKVKKAVYAGTIVVVSGYGYHVKDDIKGKTTFFLNLEKQAVEIAG
ncbi:MAG: DUF342 domain-containing protein [Deltaproteobacteria bacterium]|nr:DUF342 domain-containing protein [Deltaproteobacteria bacterium]